MAQFAFDELFRIRDLAWNNSGFSAEENRFQYCLENSPPLPYKSRSINGLIFWVRHQCPNLSIFHLSEFSSLPSFICHLSSDNLSQAALALVSRLSPPESIFLPGEGRLPRKRATLSSNGGCVENKLIKLFPDNGFTMNMWAVDGLAFMGNLLE